MGAIRPLVHILAATAALGGHVHDATIGEGPVIAGSAVADGSITLAKLAVGTDGNLISYDANGDPVAVGTGANGEVLTSNGPGTAPTMQSVAGGPLPAWAYSPQWRF